MQKEKKESVFVIDKLPQFQNYKVFKHNDLIECKSDFSAMEHRIIVLALAQITNKDENLKMYRIYIRDVLGETPLNKKKSNNYYLVRNAVERLHKSTIRLEEPDGWKSYAFITKAQGKYGVNFIEIQFHEDIQKFLLGMKSQYTSYTLENVMKFKKNYSLRIYELCKQRANFGSRTITMDSLRELFCLKDKYGLFASFKSRVLKPAMAEINNFSDIQVGFSEKREGRKVVSINFSIKHKKGVTDEEAKTLVELDVENDHTNKLNTLGFDDAEIFALREHNSENRLADVLDLFEQNIDTVKFPKPWISKALKENYVDNSAYKKQFSIAEKTQTKDEIAQEKLKKQLLEVSEYKIEKRNIKDKMEILESDLQYYREINELKPGDVMRFPKDFTVVDAIAYCEEHCSQLELDLVAIQKNLDVLM